MSKEIVKTIYLIIAIISACAFVAGLVYCILGSDSPIKLIVPPILVFMLSFTLYNISQNKQ